MQFYGATMNIIIAGGGTGGHLFPGIAIAQEFMRKNAENRIVFIGSPQGIEVRMLPKLNFTLKTVPIRGFKGKSIMGKIASLASIPVSFFRAGYFVRQARADLVIGLGGYISFPAVAAGWVLGIPTVIHEQNSVSGLANRILGRLATKVFASYEESRAYFPKEKTIVAGMPVRQNLRRELGTKDDQVFCVCILGGSQGARAINQALAAALPHMADLKNKVRFMHQSGPHDAAMLAEQYSVNGFTAEVIPFVEDMASFYGQARLVISRAGASTLAELALCGKASVLVPYPFAAHNHQEKNARVFADRGAALLVLQRDLTGEAVAGLIRMLAQENEKVRAMEAQALSLAKYNAAEMIVEECCRLAA